MGALAVLLVQAWSGIEWEERGRRGREEGEGVGVGRVKGEGGGGGDRSRVCGKNNITF